MITMQEIKMQNVLYVIKVKALSVIIFLVTENLVSTVLVQLIQAVPEYHQMMWLFMPVM